MNARFSSLARTKRRPVADWLQNTKKLVNFLWWHLMELIPLSFRAAEGSPGARKQLFKGKMWPGTENKDISSFSGNPWARDCSMLGEYPEIFCFSSAPSQTPGLGCWVALCPLCALVSWACPAHKEPLSMDLGWGTVSTTHSMSRAVRRNTVHTGFVHTGLRGVGDAGPALPEVSCWYAVGVWMGLQVIRQVKIPERKILLTYRMLWVLSVCACTQRTSRQFYLWVCVRELCLPAIQICAWLEPTAFHRSLAGAGAAAHRELLHGCVQGLFDFTAAHAGKESHFHPNMQEWAINWSVILG